MSGLVVEIELTKGKIALIESRDMTLVSSYRWHFGTHGYAATSIGGRRNKKNVLMHRMITNCPNGKYVDHINGDKLDNRRENLRIVDASENAANSKIRSDNSTGYKGVTFSKENRNWVSRIYFGGKHKHLGSFDDPHDAARMYNFWATDLFGEFARLNVIKDWEESE